MRIVLDTNVMISGVFFSGPPYEILNAWREERISLVVSSEILAEYREVGLRLASKFSGLDLGPVLGLLAVRGEFIRSVPLAEPVCDDPDDDKFLACAISSGCRLVVSGDRHLHRVDGFCGVEVFSPRAFVDKYLAQ